MLTFSSNLTRECHCYNGGTCPIQGWGFTASSGYGGPQCEYTHGRLRIFARRGQNLRDLDHIHTGLSDPYLEVTAFDHHGQQKTLYTRVVSDNLNPVWNEWLDFGENEWSWFTIQAWEEDHAYYEWLSYAYTYPLLSHITRKRQRVNGFQGFVEFDYYFQP